MNAAVVRTSPQTLTAGIWVLSTVLGRVVYTCVQFPPRSFLLRYSKVPEEHLVHVLIHAWNGSLSTSLLTLQALNHILPHFFPLHRLIWWSHWCPDHPQHLWAQPTMAAPAFQFTLCLYSLVSLQLSVLWVRQGILLVISPRLGVISSPWTEGVLLLGPSSSLEAWPLPCFGAVLQHHLTFKKTSFSTQGFIKPSSTYPVQHLKQLQWADKPVRSAGEVAQDGELHPMQTAPWQQGCKWISTHAWWKILGRSIQQRPCTAQPFLPTDTSWGFCFAYSVFAQR